MPNESPLPDRKAPNYGGLGDPKDTYQIVDDGTYNTGPSTLRPGWDPTFGSYTEYDTWLANARSDATFQKMEAKFGPKWVGFAYYAWRVNMDPSSTAFLNQLDGRFAGWRSIQNGNGPGPGSGSGVSKAQQIAGAEAAIRNQAAMLGVGLDDKAIKSLASTVVTNNWSSDQLTDYLTRSIKNFNQPGTFTDVVNAIRAAGRDQLMNVSDATAKEWARRITSDEMSLDTVKTIFAQQAAAEFGWASAPIQSGMTMRDILMPARDQIANELEVNPNDVDFMQPRWRTMIQAAGTDGKPRAATMTEVVQNARKDSAWASTANAARTAANVATLLRQTFEGG